MKLFQDLRRAVEELAPWTGCWMVCGGVAAAIYRPTPRFTGDIDIALIDAPDLKASQIGERVVAALGYEPIAGWIVNRGGKLAGPQSLVLGREPPGRDYIGIDFLLPVLPWVPEAVSRAQVNLLDYGFAMVPTITPEDLIIAKLFAYADAPHRLLDLDDLIALASDNITLDKSYLMERISRYALKIPDEIRYIRT